MNIIRTIPNNENKSGADLIIRYPVLEDHQAMADYMNTLSSERTFVRWQGYRVTYEEERSHVEKSLKKIAQKRLVQILIFADDQLIAISGIDMRGHVESHVGDFGISIAKEYRGMGIGKLLMETLLDEAKTQLPDLKIVVLSCFGSNEVAIKLYKKLGFQEYGRLPKGIKHTDQYVDEVLMYLEV